MFLRENAGDLFILVFKGEVGEFFLRDSEASLGLQFKKNPQMDCLVVMLIT